MKVSRFILYLLLSIYHISHGKIKPDPDRLQPLKELPVPYDLKYQKACSINVVNK